MDRNKRGVIEMFVMAVFGLSIMLTVSAVDEVLRKPKKVINCHERQYEKDEFCSALLNNLMESTNPVLTHFDEKTGILRKSFNPRLVNAVKNTKDFTVYQGKELSKVRIKIYKVK